MEYAISIVLIALAIGACFLVLVILAVPWAADNYKKQAYRLLNENSPDPNSLKETLEGLSSTDDEEAKELARHLTAKLVQEEEEG
jgi:predicted PurR-regulated permease PerM